MNISCRNYIGGKGEKNERNVNLKLQRKAITKFGGLSFSPNLNGGMNQYNVTSYYNGDSLDLPFF